MSVGLVRAGRRVRTGGEAGRRMSGNVQPVRTPRLQRISFCPSSSTDKDFSCDKHNGRKTICPARQSRCRCHHHRRHRPGRRPAPNHKPPSIQTVSARAPPALATRASRPAEEHPHLVTSRACTIPAPFDLSGVVLTVAELELAELEPDDGLVLPEPEPKERMLRKAGRLVRSTCMRSTGEVKPRTGQEVSLLGVIVRLPVVAVAFAASCIHPAVGPGQPSSETPHWIAAAAVGQLTFTSTERTDPAKTSDLMNHSVQEQYVSSRCWNYLPISQPGTASDPPRHAR